MAEGGQYSDFMNQMLTTGIDGNLPDVTYLAVFIKNMNGEVNWEKKYQTSVQNEHPEIQMLNDDEFLDKVMKGKTKKAGKTGKVNIILISNYSPCRLCAEELIDFYNGKKSLIRKFVIRFSRPYRTDEKLNRNGLRYLHGAGITLEAMTMESWFGMLMKYLKIYDAKPDKVMKRDNYTKKILNELLTDGEESESES